MTVAVLVGLRLTNPGWAEPDSEGYRAANWRCAKERWQRLLPYPVVEGHHDEDGPFSLAKASNRAAANAGAWTLAVYSGADFLPRDATMVEEALERARRTKQLTIAHSHTTMLREDASVLVREGTEPDETMGDTFPNPFTGIICFPRSLWDTVGGFDERFVGWGWDDQAFWASCWALAGGFQRVAGHAYHLWHPRSRQDNEEHPLYHANDVLGRRYLDAKRNRKAMLAILAER